MSTEAPPSPAGDRGSPMPGCLIFSAVVIVFGGLIALYATFGFRQNQLIDEFTVDTPAEIQAVEPTEAQKEIAMAKLREIEQAVAANRAERILFTVEDLNTLIATLEAAKDFRGQTLVRDLTSRGIVVRAAQPMRKGIFAKGHRYLNGTFVFQPELRRRTIAFKVVDVDSDEGEVPREFIQNWGVIDMFRLDPENEDIAANVPSLAAVYTEDSALVVETKIRTGEE